MQSEDLLVLSGMNFAVSPDARRKAEDALTQQAIRAWQARAQNAAQGFGVPGWRAGKVTIQTGDGGRPQPMMRMAAGMAASAPPVSVEGGNTDITVTVIGEAVLDHGARAALNASSSRRAAVRPPASTRVQVCASKANSAAGSGRLMK